MRLILAGILAMGSLQLQAQYYLQHLVVAERSADQFRQMKRNYISRMTARSIEADGQPSENFRIEQKVDAGRNTVTTYTASNFTGQSVMTSIYNGKGQVLEVSDSSSSVFNHIAYTYNQQGLLAKLHIESKDSMQQYTMEEWHELEYDQKGFPSGMLRIKNGKDTTRVIFIASENGKPAEEHWWNKNKLLETWYYYYDDKGRLTDVARFNARANRILPDYMYEYDNRGRVIKQTTVQGAGTYRIWQYEYDERGLKTKETVLNKYKQVEGTIRYEYK